jgi:predicted HTH domain antitoxin
MTKTMSVRMAAERYRQRQVSLGKAAELAGVPVGRMIEILAEYGVESNLEHEDYLKGLQNLREAW